MAAADLSGGGQVTREGADIPGPGSGLLGTLSNKAGHKRPFRMVGTTG
jgi:hypothetical protein